MVIRVVTLRYSYNGAFAGLTTHHFEGAGSLSTIQVQIGRITSAWALVGNTQSSVVADREVRRIDELTGQTTGFETLGAQTPVAGTGLGEVMAQATSLMARWDTGAVLNGRRVRGRTFFPLVGNEAAVNGEVTVTAQTNVANGLNAVLGAATARIGVWSRPVYQTPPGGTPVLVRPGAFQVCNSVTVWPEFGVQRRRRRA